MNMPHQGKRAVCYARYSSDLQHQTSIERQFQLARTYSSSNGIEIVASFKDEAVSSAKGKNLERELGRCIEFIESDGKIDFLLVESVDRLSRESPLVFIIKFGQLLLSGVRLVQVGTGTIIDPDNTMDFVNLTLQSALANEENRKKKERVSESYERRFTRGIPAPKMPYGYERVDGIVRPHPDTAPVVRTIYKMCASGTSYNQIAKDLNRQSIPHPGAVAARKGKEAFGNGWTTQAVRRILINRVYATGTQLWRRGESRGVFPKIVDESLEQQVLRRISVVQQRKTYPARMSLGKSSNLFSDLMFCGSCGTKVHIVASKSPTCRRYGCQLKIAGACDNRFTCSVDDCERAILKALEECIETGKIGEVLENIKESNKSAIVGLRSRLCSIQSDLKSRVAVRKRLNTRLGQLLGEDEVAARAVEAELHDLQVEIEKLESSDREIRSAIEDAESRVEAAFGEIATDVESIRGVIRSGGTEISLEFDAERAFEAITQGEIGHAVKAACEPLAEAAKRTRLQLKAIIAGLIQKVTMFEDGKVEIQFSDDRMESLDLTGLLSRSIS